MRRQLGRKRRASQQSGMVVVGGDEGGVFDVANGGKEGRGVHVQRADRG